MRKIIDKLKLEPEKKRKQISAIVSGSLTSIILIMFIFVGNIEKRPTYMEIEDNKPSSPIANIGSVITKIPPLLGEGLTALANGIFDIFTSEDQYTNKKSPNNILLNATSTDDTAEENIIIYDEPDTNEYIDDIVTDTSKSLSSSTSTSTPKVNPVIRRRW